MISGGTRSLSDAELVAILLRSGIKNKDAVSLARELIVKFGGLRGLFSIGGAELKRVKGLGQTKICSLLVVSELTRRYLREELIGKAYVREPRAVVKYLKSTLRDRKTEVFKVLFLDKSNRIIDERDLFEGTIDEAIVHPREVVKTALELYAAGLILVHNHPSGRIQPSPEDYDITRKLQSACDVVNIRVLDHIIVGDNKHYSFSSHGIL
uniref:DNA repair protein RadC n=1 Tax=uncultured bacterium W4-21b TaxID=1130993 RepID=H9BWN2_9BACT|nr:DNA repair protein RadC [uncultured bacterium W4-21b]